MALTTSPLPSQLRGPRLRMGRSYEYRGTRNRHWMTKAASLGCTVGVRLASRSSDQGLRKLNQIASPSSLPGQLPHHQLHAFGDSTDCHGKGPGPHGKRTVAATDSAPLLPFLLFFGRGKLATVACFQERPILKLFPPQVILAYVPSPSLHPMRACLEGSWSLAQAWHASKRGVGRCNLQGNSALVGSKNATTG